MSDPIRMWMARALRGAAALAAALALGGGPMPAVASAYGEVVISEVLYDSKSSGVDDDDEWVELYNPGQAAVDLGGWLLSDDSVYPSPPAGEGECVLPAGTLIPAGAFLVVSASPATGLAGVVVCAEQSGSLSLSNSGDNLALVSDLGELVHGSFGRNFPDSAAADAGDSVGLKNPMAGWSSLAADWAAETAVSSESTAKYAHDSHGAANSGWAGVLTTPHDITVDGTLDTVLEWRSGELLGAVDGFSYYATWSADRVYLGVSGGLSSTHTYVALVDVDPLDAGAANAGVTAEYCGATFPADAKPDFALHHSPSGAAALKANAAGTAWEAWTPAASLGAAGAAQAEFAFSRADIGLASAGPVAVYAYACNGASLLASAWPPENPGPAAGVVELAAHVHFETTGPLRSPREEAARAGAQTLSAAAAGSLVFLDGFASLDVTAPGGPGCLVTVQLLGNHLASRLDGGARRSYTLTPQGCSGLAAGLTLKYEDGALFSAPGELRGLAEASLRLFRWDGAAWLDMAGTPDAANNRVSLAGVTSFSTWSFGTAAQPPTAVRLASIEARAHVPSPAARWTYGALAALAVAGSAWLARRRG